MAMASMYLPALLVGLCFGAVVDAEVDIDFIATYLNVKYEVISNLKWFSNSFDARVTLTNSGDRAIDKGSWEIYFTQLYWVEPGGLIPGSKEGYEIKGTNLRVYHINGGLFKFVPTNGFQGIDPSESLVVNLVIQNWSVSMTDSMPNWYVADANSGLARTIKSTATENLESFNGDFDSPEKWKRYPDDRYNPWTPAERWSRNDVTDMGGAPSVAIPTPKSVVTDEAKGELQRPLNDWVIYTAHTMLENEANILKDKMRWAINTTEPASKCVKLVLGSALDPSYEGYELEVDGDREVIVISSNSSAGIYYGVQTLISILETRGNNAPSIPSMTIKDSPRYGYRGMHMDVARHFVSYEDVIKIIKVMGMYKLNKFHFHLTDDEGWRVEMPWSSYLTEVGAKQCHDLSEKQCLIPQFGSNSDGTGSGSGYYTTEEYKSILRTAAANHIEVIPEVDMPGHARAAIKAMEAFLQADPEAAETLQLSDPLDASTYMSVQLYTDNALNPCLNTTYNFVRKLVETFIEYHRGILPLKTMHLGGDEVAHGAWIDSPQCQKLIADKVVHSVSDIKEYFVKRISEVVNQVDSNLTLGLWEDGTITSGEVPFNISELKTKTVLTNAWQNIWEWGLGNRAYKLANAGYKVVMCQATHTYFDHPAEPDPLERGLYWATRFSNTRKTFGFLPDDLYANSETKRNGDPYPEETLCAETDCVPLSEESKQNIIGMQGHIWTETIRTSEELFGNIFPRMLALAERAWHKASWEIESSKSEEEEDWAKFANNLGYRELRRLDDLGISYRVPVAGVKMMNGLLHANSQFPGLEITYRSSKTPFRKSKYINPIDISEDTFFNVESSDGSREGRVILVTNDVKQRIASHVALAMAAFAALLLTS